jgi:NADPH2:quinone reductase
MRAVRYHEHGDPSVLQIDDLERPTAGPNEILLEICAASVNAVDTRFRAGTYGSVSLPAIPGGDAAGVVREVGNQVSAFEVGDRVFASGMGHDDGGTFAEYGVVPAMKVAHLPEDVSFQEGSALANVGVTAWMALVDRVELKPTEYCLVHGGNGGVGHAAVQLATAMGADVIATASSETMREGVRELGAVAALDYNSDTLEADIREVTDGVGVDVILDHHLDDYLGLDFAVAAQGAQVLSITGNIPRVEDAPLQHKELTLRGLSIANTQNRRTVLQYITRLMVRGDLTAEIAATYNLGEAAEAHRIVTEGGYLGKVVVTP